MKRSISLLVLILSLVSQAATQSTLDLTHHDFRTVIPLSGKWDFYWNELLTPDDFNKPRPGSVMNVPSSWNRSEGNFATLGYGTYHLRISVPDSLHNLSLFIPVINCSAKIWVNGVLEEELGKVSSKPESYEAKLSSAFIALPEYTNHIDLVIQAANFSYTSSGMVASPLIGTSSTMFRRLNQQRGIENFFAGSLFAMFIYQLALFLAYNRGKPYLFLALICLAVALRALTTHGGSFMLPDLFPTVSWEYWKKIEYFSVYSSVALLACYIFFLFRQVASVKPLLFFIGLALLLDAMVALTPQYIYGRLLDISHISLLAAFAYIGIVMRRAWRNGDQDAKILLIGFLCSLPFFILEILRTSNIFWVRLPYVYLVESGVLIFLLFQIYLLSHHYSQSYKKLELLNQSLEQKVAGRTSELTTATRIKDKLLSVISHDIKSPLNTLRGTLTIFKMGAVDESEMRRLMVNVDEQLVQTTVLVENILLWTRSQLKGVKIVKQSFSLQALIDEHVQLFHQAAEKKGIAFENNSEQLNVWADRDIISLVLRNLISNAIKFSGGGKISLSTSFEKGIVSLFVKDNGVGIPQDKLRKILEGDVESTYGTAKEKGTGLGLVLCLEYLKAMDSSLHADSVEGQGTTFWMTMPLSSEQTH